MQLPQMFYLWPVCRLEHGAQLMKGSEMLTEGGGCAVPVILQQHWLHPSVMRAGTRGAASATGGLFWSDHICICVQAAHSNNVVSKPLRVELSSSTKVRDERVKPLSTSGHGECGEQIPAPYTPIYSNTREIARSKRAKGLKRAERQEQSSQNWAQTLKTQICIKMAPIPEAAAAPYSHKYLDLGHKYLDLGHKHPDLGHKYLDLGHEYLGFGTSVKPSPQELCTPQTRLTPPAGMWPGHQAIAGSLMPPSKVVCLPHRKGPLLPPGDRKESLNHTKQQRFQRTLSARLVWNEFSFLHGCFFKQHGQSWVFCHCFLVCCVVVLFVGFFFQYLSVMKF